MGKTVITRFLAILILSLSAVMPASADEPIQISAPRKGVRISTDVTGIALPVAAVTGSILLNDWEGVKQGAFSAVTCLGTTMLLRWTVKKERPDHSNFHSFPSLHTSTAFATATYVQRRYGWKFGVPAYLIASYTAWGRTYAKKHDWWDVAAGAAIGVGSSLIFTRPWAKEHELNITPASDGDNFYISASFKF